jgi:hypothetical protein
VAWVGVVGLALTVASCGDGAGGGTAAGDGGGPPVLRDATAGPGTELRDGLRVPPGSRLIGRVFDAPAVSDQSAGPAAERWTALLLVDEEPRRALAAMVADAEEAGFAVSDPALDHCFRPTDADGLTRPQPAVCSVSFDRPDASVSVEAAFGPCGEGPPASHIRLEARRYPSGPNAPLTTVPTSGVEPLPSTVTAPPSGPVTPSTPTTMPPQPAPPATARPGAGPGTSGTTTVTTSPTAPSGDPEPAPVVEPEVPASWPPLPATGDLLDPRTEDGTSDVAPVALLEGTVAAAPSMVGCGAAHSSVLRVDGDPAAVVDAYAEQFAERSHEPTAVDRWDVGAARVTNVVADQAGGDKWYLTVTEEPGQPTWALVETATDA